MLNQTPKSLIDVLRKWLDKHFADEEALLLLLLVVAGLWIVVRLGHVLAPLIASMIIAYLLEGVVVRLVRPSKKNPNPTSISNHSWGTAVDIQIAGILDARGDNNIQKGLALIAPYFNKYKWYWGMAFKTEDSMHFECSRELVETFPT